MMLTGVQDASISHNLPTLAHTHTRTDAPVHTYTVRDSARLTRLGLTSGAFRRPVATNLEQIDRNGSNVPSGNSSAMLHRPQLHTHTRAPTSGAFVVINISAPHTPRAVRLPSCGTFFFFPFPSRISLPLCERASGKAEKQTCVCLCMRV